MDVTSFLKQRAQDGLFSTATQLEQFNLTPADTELHALRSQLLPMRYKLSLLPSNSNSSQAGLRLSVAVDLEAIS